MKVELAYRYRSGLTGDLKAASLSLATNTLREPTFFAGQLAKPLLARELLGTLYSVVISDLKYHPKDRTEYRAWLQGQDRMFLARLGLQDAQAIRRLEQLEARLGELDKARRKRLQPFHGARMAYFEFAYQNAMEMEYLLDPVVTIHPDEISFEVFSRDESSYARAALKHDSFSKVEEFDCGTTNIDFGQQLYRCLQRIRTYRPNRLAVRPTGVDITVGPKSHTEKKIDLPQSWVHGFLQVHSTMSVGLTRFRMSPLDLFNICHALRRRKARTSPRSLRYELTPGERTKVVLEPWEQVIELSAQSVFEGPKPVSIRTWGRRRLLTLPRLLPRARHIDVYLAGYGLPSIYTVDMGSATFTLALSGWTDNDWTGNESPFHLLTRRLEVSTDELMTTYETMRQIRVGREADVVQKTGLGVEKVRSALSYLCQVGRAMFDLGGGLYRHRDLFSSPFTPKQAASLLKGAGEGGSPAAKAAKQIFKQGDIRVIARRPVVTGFKLSGSAKGADGKRVRPMAHVDHVGRIIEASCTCAHYLKSKLTKGPCEHILALRLVHMQRLEAEQ